jgi:DNA-binding protein YbaB
VTVVARCDISIKSIDIDPALAEGSSIDQVVPSILKAANGALSAARKRAGDEMGRLASGLGLPGM